MPIIITEPRINAWETRKSFLSMMMVCDLSGEDFLNMLITIIMSTMIAKVIVIRSRNG